MRLDLEATVSDDAPMRASDAEREQTADALGERYAAGGSLTTFAICTLIWAASGADGAFWPVWVLIFPLVFVLRNIWRLHAPAPDLERVQRELARRGRGGRRGRYPGQLP
jgi:hypothetical protein